MTDEYIKKEAVLSYIAELSKICNESTLNEYGQHFIVEKELQVFLDNVVNIPSADVQPVRHGQWISDAPGKRFGTVVRLDKDGCPVDPCHCSECGEWLTASDEYPVIGYYCPNCGAKMDNPVDYCFGAKIVE